MIEDRDPLAMLLLRHAVMSKCERVEAAWGVIRDEFNARMKARTMQLRQEMEDILLQSHARQQRNRKAPK